MKCRDMDELISAYTDGELLDAQKPIVEKHLAGCPNCRAILEKQSKTRQQLLSLSQVPAMKEIKASILTKASERISARKKWRWLPPAAVRISISGVLLAALAVGLVGYFGNGSTDPDFWSKVSAATENLSEYRSTSSINDNVVYAITYNAPDIYDYEYYDYQLTASSITIRTGDAPPATTPSSTQVFVGKQETVLIGDRIYARTPEIDGLEFISGNISAPTPPQKPQSMQDAISTVSWLTTLTQLPDEKIDGVTCAHFLGEGNTINWIQQLVNKTNPQDPRYQHYFDMLAEMKKEGGGIEVQEELWVGKKDYLLRELKSIEIESGGAINSTATVSHFYYDNVSCSQPVNSSGNTLPGWYLLTDSQFTSQRTFGICTESNGHTSYRLEVDLTNSGQQTTENVQVFAKLGNDIYHSDATAAPELKPGDRQTFYFQWLLESDFNGSNPIFVEYTTRDGMNHVQILNPTQ